MSEQNELAVAMTLLVKHYGQQEPLTDEEKETLRALAQKVASELGEPTEQAVAADRAAKAQKAIADMLQFTPQDK